MARRWVTSGRLKVKKEPVGVPPRTRLVRLSDVAKIRPIVDPTAAITGDVRKLDLPSIPRQQLQIMQDHERLTKQVERALEASKQHEATTHAAIEQLTARIRELSEELSHQLSAHRDELQGVLDQAGQQHEALAAVVRDQAHQIERNRDDLVGQLHTTQAALQQAQQELERRLIEQVDQMRHDLKEQQEALVTLRRDMTTLAQQQMREVLTALEQVEHDLARDAAQFQECLEKVEQRIEQVVAQTETVQNTALGYQKRADGQESRLQEVWKLLQGEIAARQALEQQVQQNLPTRKRTT